MGTAVKQAQEDAIPNHQCSNGYLLPMNMYIVFAGKYLDTQVLAKVIISDELVLLPQTNKRKRLLPPISKIR